MVQIIKMSSLVTDTFRECLDLILLIVVRKPPVLFLLTLFILVPARREAVEGLRVFDVAVDVAED